MFRAINLIFSVGSLRKNLYIHIGLHKTGSTTLQHFLKINKNVLKKLGYLYAETGLVYSGHHNFSWNLKNDSRFKEQYGCFDKLQLEIDSISVNNIILSSEAFESLPPELVKQLKYECRFYNTTIVVYLR